MQAVILAAGRGRRMGELTRDYPKPLLKIKGRPILDYLLANLPKEITEVIFVIGHHGQKIKNHFGESHGGRKIRYVWQQKLDGAAGALFQLKKILGYSFLVLNGSDLYRASDLKKLLAHDLAALAKEEEGCVFDFGSFEVDGHGHLVGIEPLTKNFRKKVASTGAWRLNQNIFAYAPGVLSNVEFDLSQLAGRMVKDFKIKVETTDFWHHNATAEDLKKAEEILEEFFK